MTKLVASYALKLDERGGVKEQIKGFEIGLKFNVEEGSQSLKKKQKALKAIPFERKSSGTSTDFVAIMSWANLPWKSI